MMAAAWRSWGGCFVSLKYADGSGYDFYKYSSQADGGSEHG